MCGTCSPRNSKKPVHPVNKPSKTIHGIGAIVSDDARRKGYVLVKTKTRDDPTFLDLNKDTSIVHIHGHPNLWAIEKILSLAPNLQTLRVIPALRSKLGSRHEDLCRKSGVEITTGHHKPNMAWEEGRNVSPQYQHQQSFLLNLEGEQKKLFDELIMFGFEEAEITSRYFCLNGEAYVSQRLLTGEYGYKESLNHVISAKIMAVLFYLDPQFKVGEGSQLRANAIKSRVISLREQFLTDIRRAEVSNALKEKYGVEIPPKFPLAKIGTLEKLAEARKSGHFDSLKWQHSNVWKALTLRYDFDNVIYRRLAEVGEIIGVTRERVRQLESEAFTLLGINSEEESS